ncbi:MAG: XRE family transcriptional regulator [Moorea sp. SIO3G5]|nr:XRE family transcriptional regulator [Moorena sp. SIO3G5]
MVKEIEVQASSGNVFADLGLENSDELIVKAELARKISSIIANQGMTQAAAAKVLGVDQPKVSALINGKLAGFSIVRLFRFLNALVDTPRHGRTGILSSSTCLKISYPSKAIFKPNIRSKKPNT